MSYNSLGISLNQRITQNFRVNRYAIDTFFIEVVYDVQHHTLIEVRPFKTGYLLDKYSAKF
ncbi:MAG: hypothetical protein ACI9OE_002192 [Mariniflexile sp.]|jgi:hypothetical protein